jgi:curved DNA-binding protein CbpA
MESKRRDYYTLLGIDRGASADEIGRAYRRAARATHPDVHPDEPSAAERFTAITLAYETLCDPARRASYDRAQSGAPQRRRVEPVSHPPAYPRVEPIHVGRRPGLRVEPLHPSRPLHRDIQRTLVQGEFVELTATLARLLRWGPF